MDKTSMTNNEKERYREHVHGGIPVDMLRALFHMQGELDQTIFDKHPEKLPEDLHEWVMKYTIALESEIDEIRREVSWKWWKPKQEIDMEHLHEEVSDLWFFLIALTQRVGMGADDIMDVYKKKLAENYARQEGNSKEGSKYDYREGEQQ
jgi:dimeric dUTPase (all-alpha-NTP-PPase superfamily)